MDLNIQIQNNKFICSTYHKPVSRNSFILFSSCHLPRWLLNIPTGQFRRLKRNCTLSEQFEKEADILTEQFLSRDYPRKIVLESLDKVRSMNRDDFFLTKTKQYGEEPLRIILPFSSKYKRIETIIKKHWGHLLEDKVIGPLLNNKPLISYTKSSNLGLLVAPTAKKPKVQSTSNWLTQKGFFRCGVCQSCRTTNFPRKTVRVCSTQDSFQLEIKECLTCNSTDVIYVLECPCRKQYIGRTKRPLKKRIAEHMANIRKGYMLHSVSRHYKERHNSDPSTLHFCALEKVHRGWRGGNHIYNMSRLESRRIFEFNSLIPRGLNAELEIFGFL